MNELPDMPGDARNARAVMVVVALVGLVTAAVILWVNPGTEEEPALVRTGRYECLIIRNLTGVDDVVTSPGFPPYYEVGTGPLTGGRAIPSASEVRQSLGTLVKISVYGMDRDGATQAVIAGMDRIDELSKKMNIFKPDSYVNAVNRDAHKGPMPIDSDLSRLIAQSLEAAQLSGGSFDPTVGPLTGLWRRYRKEKKLPPADEVKRVTGLVDYRKVTLTSSPTVQFATEGMSFDFGGIAKGFAAEEAARVLTDLGVRSAIVDCGGDLIVIGARLDGTPFAVSVTSPDAKDKGTDRFYLFLANMSIVTSGNYRQYVTIDGKRYSHIVDPRTGQAIEAEPSVTVVGPDAGMCDALATAISVLGEEEGLKLIERVNAAAADMP